MFDICLEQKSKLKSSKFKPACTFLINDEARVSRNCPKINLFEKLSNSERLTISINKKNLSTLFEKFVAYLFTKTKRLHWTFKNALSLHTYLNLPVT